MEKYEKATAKEIITLLKEDYLAKHHQMEQHSKLTIKDMLTMALKYWR